MNRLNNQWNDLALYFVCWIESPIWDSASGWSRFVTHLQWPIAALVNINTIWRDFFFYYLLRPSLSYSREIFCQEVHLTSDAQQSWLLKRKKNKQTLWGDCMRSFPQPQTKRQFGLQRPVHIAHSVEKGCMWTAVYTPQVLIPTGCVRNWKGVDWKLHLFAKNDEEASWSVWLKVCTGWHHKMTRDERRGDISGRKSPRNHTVRSQPTGRSPVDCESPHSTPKSA